MNLNYDNFNIENISEEVRSLYKFPEDKELLNKIVKGERYFSKEYREESTKNATLMSFAIVGLGLTGVISYMYLGFPAGKVIRDRHDASLPFWRRVSRRAIPFIGLALPFILMRESQIMKTI